MTTQQTSAVDRRAERADSGTEEAAAEEAAVEAREDRPVNRAEDRSVNRAQAQPPEASVSAANGGAVETGEAGSGSHAEPGTPYLPDQTSDAARERWQHIQADFVDDPRKSVTEAHQLVSELTQRIVDAFAQERGDLEQQWSKGDSVSTEDLRVCLQRYRAFFSRLLPSVHDIAAAE